MKLSRDMLDNILDTMCDDLITVANASREEGLNYFPTRLLEASKEAWERLTFYVARGWMSEEEKGHIWEGYENCLSEWLEDWEDDTLWPWG